MNNKRETILKQLIKKGVQVPCPESVEIGSDIDPERISGENVTIHAGCKIYGAQTLIMPGVELGREAPVTIDNCQLGKDVYLGGGFFLGSCFFEKSSMGLGAQIRESCLLEEGVRGAHCVGLKHTILFPFVTLGSLINFCDCLMAGGTDEKNHSELGSSYIHFNFTPNQDKATASLIGDVPVGVMLRKRPIFLGGQGGLVGPVKIGYGIVVGAGNIVRKDILQENTLFIGQVSANLSMPFFQGLYTNIRKIIAYNTEYIANLAALRQWHLEIRSRLMAGDPMTRALLEGAVDKLDKAISERIKRLGEVADKMPLSIEVYKSLSNGPGQSHVLKSQQEFFEKWEMMETVFRKCLTFEGEASQKEVFLKIIENAARKNGRDYLGVIKGLTEAEASAGTAWLQGLVEQIKESAMAVLPSLTRKKRQTVAHSNSFDSSVG